MLLVAQFSLVLDLHVKVLVAHSTYLLFYLILDITLLP